ncbi:cell division protein FtsZ [Terrimicrobium sacchariphilum]|uniref:Cell division protein FtsZ n=1 Tax=Terrimicrobium sacchariphilum TaxID=690879 RepID=A0A146GC88_TERSA|nr:cell division protein FtsZ [Terrimicrobium sacchariphilum]GAT34317.1 cell division protein FtsZ [Terrimicrobium sacchariphilum]
MISYPRSEAGEPASVQALVLGLGNAGVHLVDRLTMSGIADADFIALNTDAQSLTSSITQTKIALGQKVTRGLGTGGDPEVGYEAAQESLGEIRSALEGAQIVFLCTGLGGGTGSGVAPVIAESAREAGAIVISIVTSPFSFEGKRRSAQAREGLAGVAEFSHAVLHFENDRMSELASPRAGIEETFSISDNFLGSAVISLLEILRGGAPLPVGLADVLSVLGGGSAAALFGRGEATGDNRAHEALERALKSPLLDRGRLLAESHAIISHISGPASLSFAEVAAIMRELGKHVADSAQLFLGVTSLRDANAPITVTLIGNYSGGEHDSPPVTEHHAVERPAPRQRPTFAAPTPHHEAEESTTAPRQRYAPSPVAEEPAPLFSEPVVEPVAEAPEAPAPVSAPPAARPAATREHRPAAAPKQQPQPVAPPTAPKVKQETLQFESVARGRFEKSEPTIVEGEDLDVPTFLRMRGKTR